MRVDYVNFLCRKSCVFYNGQISYIRIMLSRDEKYTYFWIVPR